MLARLTVLIIDHLAFTVVEETVIKNAGFSHIQGQDLFIGQRMSLISTEATLLSDFEDTSEVKSNEDITPINQVYFNNYRSSSNNFWYVFSFILLLFFSLLIRKIYHEE